MSADASPWKTIRGVCERAQCGRKVVYKAIADKRLRAAYLDGRRKIIVHQDWIDAWLEASAPRIIELPRRDRGAA